MHAREMHAHEMHIREMYTREIYAHRSSGVRRCGYCKGVPPNQKTMSTSNPHHGQNAAVLLSRTYVFTAFGGPGLMSRFSHRVILSATLPGSADRHCDPQALQQFVRLSSQPQRHHQSASSQGHPLLVFHSQFSVASVQVLTL
jgi:hypothetical protein